MQLHDSLNIFRLIDCSVLGIFVRLIYFYRNEKYFTTVNAKNRDVSGENTMFFGATSKYASHSEFFSCITQIPVRTSHIEYVVGKKKAEVAIR
jgi:hypothetical protein